MSTTIAPGAATGIAPAAAAVTPIKKTKRPFGFFFWASAFWLLLITVCAVFADVLPFKKVNDNDYSLIDKVSTGHWLQTFSHRHWLGIDENGYDMLSWAVHGARTSLTVGLGTVALAVVVGGFLGMIAGYFGGKFDSLLTFLTNAILSIPPLLYLLLLVAIVSARSGSVSTWKFIVTLGTLLTPVFYRVVRAATMQQAGREYVLASRTLGARQLRVLTHEILPNVIKPAMAFALVGVGTVMVIEGGLSFLGAGLSGETITWGKMLQAGAGLGKLKNQPHTTFVPGGFLFLTVLSLNFIGDKVRERMEVKQSGI